MIRVRGTADILRLTAAVTLFALTVVTAALLNLYPQEEWLWELSVSWPLTIFLTGTVTALVGRQMLHIHLLNEELTRIVSRDRLTDVATRDFFFENMQDDPTAYGVSLMVDIDFFKRVNDTYGHLAGDKVIARVAGVLKRETRPEDIVCRFGGEEFIVFLSNADYAAGAIMAERLRAVIAATPVISEGTHIRVTVSIGGSLKDATERIDASIRRADLALYRAKMGGRDRIEMAQREAIELPKIA